MAVREDMDSLTTVLQKLKANKQDNEIAVTSKGMVFLKGKLYLKKDLHIIKTFRFEGESDPAEQAIIYLIRSNDGVVGYGLDNYGMYTNHTSDGFAELIEEMNVRPGI